MVTGARMIAGTSPAAEVAPIATADDRACKSVLPGAGGRAARGRDGLAVWVQGDLEGNCLLRDGRLCGVVDWGSACAGDPAVDVQVVWSPLFTETSRMAFLEELDVDEATLARSRGAAVQQACAALPYYLDTYPLIVERSWHKLETLGVGRARS